MALKVYLCPVEATPEGRRPLALAASRSLSKRGPTHALIADDQNHCLFVVDADEFADMESIGELIPFSDTPHEKFSQHVVSMEAIAFDDHPHKTQIEVHANRLMKKSMAGSSVASVLRDFMKHLEPAAFDGMFERQTPNTKQTITDNFNRGSLGSGWAANEGTIWVMDSSIQVKPVSIYTTTSIIRTEAAFPDDQYSQCDTGVSVVSDGQSFGGAAARMNGDTYYFAYGDNVGFVSLYRRNSGSSTYIGDGGAGSFPTGTPPTIATIKLQCVGTAIDVFVNSSGKISTTNSSISSGKPGMMQITHDAVVTHDNFESTDASGGGPPVVNVGSMLAMFQ